MDEVDSIIVIIDDDDSFRRSTVRLIRSMGYSVQSFSTAADFLRSRLPDAPTCVVLDVRLPGLSGLDLQGALPKAGIQIPIIFITAHGDIPMSVQTMKAGAVEFLTKPFRSQDLLDAIQLAIARDRKARTMRAKLAGLRACYEFIDCTGARGAGMCGFGNAQQAGSRKIENHRKDRQVSSRSHHAKDASTIFGRSGSDGGASGNRALTGPKAGRPGPRSSRIPFSGC